jgi:hypothetical protein
MLHGLAVSLETCSVLSPFPGGVIGIPRRESLSQCWLSLSHCLKDSRERETDEPARPSSDPLYALAHS